MNDSGEIEVYIGLGSNQGDREEYLKTAIDIIEEEKGVRLEAISDFIETDPWGFEAETRFINCVARLKVEKSVTPVCLLELFKFIERCLGRNDSVEYSQEGSRIYHSRNIDIDILFYGNERISTAILTIPHPLISQRDFVLVPLRQVATSELVRNFPFVFGHS